MDSVRLIWEVAAHIQHSRKFPPRYHAPAATVPIKDDHPSAEIVCHAAGFGDDAARGDDSSGVRQEDHGGAAARNQPNSGGKFMLIFGRKRRAEMPNASDE
ncbi:hypothetical protein [Nonomuraea rubra]|uniref:Uncharacterized protein n=1 Tax=Nonomuraea rubra TaxID=46180 RepID=A0A7X0NPH0_9ACTN|nr:hypothetical protein [Nonomuraea rubra]MBB6547177.1 hypothetical protein [Nonomuraea rubra]